MKKSTSSLVSTAIAVALIEQFALSAPTFATESHYPNYSLGYLKHLVDPDNNPWDFDEGRGYVDGDQSRLIKNPDIVVSTFAELKAALENESISSIRLSADITGDNDTHNSSLNITRSVTLDLAYHTLTFPEMDVNAGEIKISPAILSGTGQIAILNGRIKQESYKNTPDIIRINDSSANPSNINLSNLDLQCTDKQYNYPQENVSSSQCDSVSAYGKNKNTKIYFSGNAYSAKGYAFVNTGDNELTIQNSIINGEVHTQSVVDRIPTTNINNSSVYATDIRAARVYGGNLNIQDSFLYNATSRALDIGFGGKTSVINIYDGIFVSGNDHALDISSEGSSLNLENGVFLSGDTYDISVNNNANVTMKNIALLGGRENIYTYIQDKEITMQNEAMTEYTTSAGGKFRVTKDGFYDLALHTPTEDETPSTPETPETPNENETTQPESTPTENETTIAVPKTGTVTNDSETAGSNSLDYFLIATLALASTAGTLGLKRYKNHKKIQF